MRVSASQLGRFAAGPAELPPPVEPQLWLVEEIVLLSLDAPAHRVRSVARVAGTRTAHLQARARLASIAAPPRSVAALADELGVTTMPDLAERLLPGPVNRAGPEPPRASMTDQSLHLV